MKIQILVLLVICSTALAWWRPRAVVGSPCKTTRPETCGNGTLVVEQLTGPRFGANVCRKYRQYPVYSYEYKQACFNKTTRFGATRRACYLYCNSTNRCDSVVNTSSIITCCDGYTTNGTSYYGYYYRQRLDCPIKLEDTVVDCINKLGLTAASDLIAQEGLQGSLNNQAQQFTLFVPTNEALADLDADEEDDLNGLLLSHAINGKRRAEQLFGGRKISSLADGRFIHTTTVQQVNKRADSERSRSKSNSRSKSHSKSTSHSNSKRFAGHSKDYYSNARLFVNGEEVIRGDACLARNGIVHVINGVIRSSNKSLLSVLNSNPDLTKFASLVRKARSDRLLNSKKTLVTVFAPEDSSISDHVQDCLCQPQNKRALYRFVASHITKGAETNSTITLRDKIYSKYCYYYGYYRKCGLEVVVENGEVTIGDSEVTDTDIPASNGVLHIISEPFKNPKLDLDKLCPPPTGSGAPPATTSAPPATASESRPATTSESPATASESPATASESRATTSESPATTSGSPVVTDPTRPPEEA